MSRSFVLPHIVLLRPMLIVGMQERSGVQVAAHGKDVHSSASQNKDVAPNQEYTLFALAHGRAADGTDLTIRVCISSDGTRVAAAHGRFKSSAAARTELELQLRQDGKILERGPRTDASGKVVGQKAIAQFSATDVLPDRSAVLFTDGRDYYQISSSSMSLTVDMAKRYYNY